VDRREIETRVVVAADGSERRERTKKRGKKEKENEQFLNPSMFIS
jgi:hypothetical protein